MNRLLIVIPAYNEEESIEEVVNNIKENYSRNYNSLVLGFKLLTYLDDLNEQAVNINYG